MFNLVANPSSMVRSDLFLGTAGLNLESELTDYSAVATECLDKGWTNEFLVLAGRPKLSDSKMAPSFVSMRFLSSHHVNHEWTGQLCGPESEKRIAANLVHELLYRSANCYADLRMKLATLKADLAIAFAPSNELVILKQLCTKLMFIYSELDEIKRLSQTQEGRQVIVQQSLYNGTQSVVIDHPDDIEFHFDPVMSSHVMVVLHDLDFGRLLAGLEIGAEFMLNSFHDLNESQRNVVQQNTDTLGFNSSRSFGMFSYASKSSRERADWLDTFRHERQHHQNNLLGLNKPVLEANSHKRALMEILRDAEIKILPYKHWMSVHAMEHQYLVMDELLAYATSIAYGFDDDEQRAKIAFTMEMQIISVCTRKFADCAIDKIRGAVAKHWLDASEAEVLRQDWRDHMELYLSQLRQIVVGLACLKDGTNLSTLLTELALHPFKDWSKTIPSNPLWASRIGELVDDMMINHLRRLGRDPLY